MRVLVLGASGMLGHKLWQVSAYRFEAYSTVRLGREAYSRYRLFDPDRTMFRVCVQDYDSVVRAVATVRPSVVVNCIGIVKQARAARDPLASIAVNALFPHRLARLCQAIGARLIHISTDCVFSGRKGGYSESDLADAEDLYGRTKLLGEVEYDSCLTVRTSMIGRELKTTNGLLEWFLSQDGKTVSGYTRAIFSGLTTQALAEVIAGVIGEHPELQGIWHVASKPISKFDLLSLVKRIYGVGVHIEPDSTVVSDRSLNGDRFRNATGLAVPSWPDMIAAMAQDPTPYAEIRRQHVDR